jgi:hypothetical protein
MPYARSGALHVPEPLQVFRDAADQKLDRWDGWIEGKDRETYRQTGRGGGHREGQTEG